VKKIMVLSLILCAVFTVLAQGAGAAAKDAKAAPQDKDAQIQQLTRDKEQLTKDKEQLTKDNTQYKTQIQEVIDYYKTKSFDELLGSSNKITVQRDRRLAGNNADVSAVLSNLEVCFEAEELFSKRFNATEISAVQEKLKRVQPKPRAAMLESLKSKLKDYKDFNDELKKAVAKVIDLDKRSSVAGGSSAQREKSKDILFILGDYMYNYYDYVNYPYLSNIVLEIIKRKYQDANAPVADLLEKL